ncbi:MAG: thioredoxin domain-containing protein [Bacteroidota bacterium]
MKFSICIVVMFFLLSACNNKQLNSQKQRLYTNKLIDESSPYLLQHAHNPVNWYPWKEEALNKAKAENKLIVISIGYAACHWCHVMEHESFEDTTVARFMNDHFVSIKVDREERPDIDNIYMTACQLASEQGCGWPLNIFALPDGKPVWAGTYFPKKTWLNILTYFNKEYEKDPAKLQQYAAQLTQGINDLDQIVINEKEEALTAVKLKTYTDKFLDRVDFKKGGRSGAPKFPMPNSYSYLLKYYYQLGDEKALEAVNTTLENLAKGGIYDQLGGGFSRYSTDEDWKVPHFEKMLYDNGQLVSLYAQAYQLSQEERYKNIVEETLEFVKRELSSPEGGFYASLDADSEGEEGKFYVWTQEEIEEVVKDPKLLALAIDYFEVKKNGNWEEVNVLYRKKSLEAIAEKYQMDVNELNVAIDKIKTQLFNQRTKRIRPGLDDKILTSWTAIMMKGYLDAYQAFGEKEYLSTAEAAGQFIIDKMMQSDYRLNRNYKNEKSVINAFLDDYAFSIQAFIALYEVSFDTKWLSYAKGLTEYTIQHFYKKENLLFNYTSDLDPALISKKAETSDNVIPASNSVMARNLHRLGVITYQEEYVKMAKSMLNTIIPQLEEYGDAGFFSNWMHLYIDLMNPPYEVVIIGKDYENLRKNLSTHYLPNAIYLGGPEEGELELLKYKLQEGRTMIYVCQNKVCKLPVEAVNTALEQLTPR